ncbi:MAG: carbohydrate ABC transporter permease [Clostridia bacterium]|nr:carbohydrate ABC transporter permease [Clostridia bacterium]
MMKQSFIRTSVGSRIMDAVIYALLIIVALLCLLPFLHVVAMSLSSNGAVISQRVFFWPVEWSMDGYRMVLDDPSMMRSLGITVLLTVGFTLLGMILTVLAAYPLTKKELKGRGVISFMFMFTMYFGGGLIPEYLLMNDLKMLNTLWSLLLPLAFSAYNIIIMRSFIESSIPASLEEAAFLDGANYWSVLFRVVLPLSKPVLATLCLFFAVGRWNAYGDALYFISASRLYPLQLKLYYLMGMASDAANLAEGGTGSYVTGEVIKATCVMFATLPIIILYPFLQRYFVTGIMIGAVKG